MPPWVQACFNKTYSGKSGAAKKFRNEKNSDNNVKHFVVSLIKYGLQIMFCWLWHHAIDRVVNTPDRILTNAHLSYTKILALHIINRVVNYGNKFPFRSLQKFIRWIKPIPDCDIAYFVYVKLELIRKILIRLQKTWNDVVPISFHKLRERVFRSFSCFFTFIWWPFVTF